MTIWRSRGLRWSVAVAALIAAAMASLFTLIVSEAAGMLTSGIDRSLTEQLSLLAARPSDLLPFMITSRMNGGAAVVTQVGLFTSGRSPIVGALSRIPAGLALDGRAHRALGEDNAIPVRAAGKTLPDGRVLVVTRDASDVDGIRGALLSAGVRLALPALVATILGGLFIGYYAERRIRNINATAEAIMRGDLSLRLPVERNGDELDRLCSIFNRVLDRLEIGIDALRRSGENIAHDLRTPLTAVRAKLERGARISRDTPQVEALFEQSIATIDHSLGAVTALLRIADLEHGRRTSAFHAFPLAPMLRETAETFLPIAEDRGLALTCSAADNSTIVADRELMIEAIANLLDNALKFTPTGGAVSMSVTSTDGAPTIVIADTGPGIPERLRVAVLDRFFQIDDSRHTKGHGLGLSLVRAICDLHRFHLKIDGDSRGAIVSIVCARPLDQDVDDAGRYGLVAGGGA